MSFSKEEFESALKFQSQDRWPEKFILYLEKSLKPQKANKKVRREMKSKPSQNQCGVKRQILKTYLKLT